MNQPQQERYFTRPPRDIPAAEMVVANVNFWGWNMNVTRGQRFSIHDEIVRQNYQAFEWPARPVTPEDLKPGGELDAQ
jgi:hypothetical protein